MSYDVLLLDLDHTLLDSSASETAAFAHTLATVGLKPTEQLFAGYSEINRALWAAVERGETTPVELRLTRFERFVDQQQIDGDPHAMAQAFTDGLGGNGELYPGAREVLDKLAAAHRLAMVTNGLSEVQRARIERLDLDRYFEAVVISAEVGVSKPGTEIFDIVFEQLGSPTRDRSLMIGDSLTSDIQGGFNYGIDTCWYNPSGNGAVDSAGPAVTPTPTPTPTPTHSIADLADLPGIAAG